MRKNDAIIVSGIGPGKGGVGILVKNLIAKYSSNKTSFYFIFNPPLSLSQYVKNKMLFSFLINSLRWIFSFISVNAFLFLIKKRNITIIYPQHLWLGSLKRVLKRNTVSIYIMDSSFFCIKSYNCKNNQECLDCIKTRDKIDKSCKPFPKIWTKKNAKQKIELIKKFSSEINFLCQNNMNEYLLKECYGPLIKTKIVGMNTGEFCRNITFTSKAESFDIVYHGDNNPAKGINYVIEIAKYLVGHTFLIPLNKHDLRINHLTTPKNIIFKELRWETGLRDYVSSARLVLCPSLWSTTIEGALLKSIAFNGNVAVVENIFGFQSEIPKNVILKLNLSPVIATEQIKNFFEMNNDFKKESKNWLKQYCNKNRKLEIF